MQAFFYTLGEKILTLVKASGWRDIVDILLVAYIIYTLITLVRRTRAAQLLRGIIVLFLAYFLSRELELKTMKFLIEKVLSFGLIALVVVFQPELRRALEQVGRSKLLGDMFFGGRMESEEKERWMNTCVLVSDACEKMSRDRTGALIVIERRTGLDETISTGTIVHADVSAELLETIFYTGSPLHDGAVIIRDARVEAAGCLLPVSQNNALDKELGTRHRAGLGITEGSDAIAVIVSEETGTVSIAKDGFISRGYDRADLFRVLSDELIPKDDEEEKKNFVERLLHR